MNPYDFKKTANLTIEVDTTSLKEASALLDEVMAKFREVQKLLHPNIIATGSVTADHIRAYSPHNATNSQGPLWTGDTK